jgi:hypothetical protein
MLQPRGYRGLRDESPQRAGPPEVADRQGETAPELRFLERIVRMMLPWGSVQTMESQQRIEQIVVIVLLGAWRLVA